MKSYFNYLVLGCLSAYAVSSFAMEPTVMDIKNNSMLATQTECISASKACLLEVKPDISNHGNRIYNIRQLCSDAQRAYLYKLPMKEQLAQRTFLGKSLCSGVVSISDMGLPFSKYAGIGDANDGLLAVEVTAFNMNRVMQLLTSMKQLADHAISDSLSTKELLKSNSEFVILMSETGRVAYTTSFAGFTLLDGAINHIDVPYNNGKKHITIPLANLTPEHLKINRLSIDKKVDAKIAAKKLDDVIRQVKQAWSQVIAAQPALKKAAEQDATLTTIDLNEDIFVVKRSGNLIPQNKG